MLCTWPCPCIGWGLLSFVSCGGVATFRISALTASYCIKLAAHGFVCAAGTCWESEPEEAKGSSAEPGKAVAPEGVRFTQVSPMQ